MPTALPIFEFANENGGLSIYLRKPGASTGKCTITRATAGGHVFVAMLRRAQQFIVHRRQRCLGKADAQTAIGLDRSLVGRHDEQDRNRNRAPPRFLDKTDLMGDREKRLKQFVTEIDDLGGIIVRNQPVEQRHLSIDVANVRRDHALRQKLRERMLAGIEIERRNCTAFLRMKISEQPRQQGFADARARRCDNGDGIAE